MSDSNPVHPVDLHYATFLSLAVLVLLGVGLAVLDRDPSYIVATTAPTLVCYGAIQSGKLRHLAGWAAGTTRFCPDCGRPLDVVGTVRRCCPSPELAIQLEAAHGDQWVADMRRMAALDRIDAFIADENAAAEAAGRPVPRWARWRTRIATWLWLRRRTRDGAR